MRFLRKFKTKYLRCFCVNWRSRRKKFKKGGFRYPSYCGGSWIYDQPKMFHGIMGRIDDGYHLSPKCKKCRYLRRDLTR